MPKVVEGEWPTSPYFFAPAIAFLAPKATDNVKTLPLVLTVSPIRPKGISEKVDAFQRAERD
jgi:hypothetical protein